MMRIPLPVTRVLVVGDIMAGHYWFSDMPGQLHEEPLCGAVNVARSATALGAHTGLFCVAARCDEQQSQDKQLERLNELLPSYDVVVLSDFPQKSATGIEHVMSAARQAGKKILAKPTDEDFFPYLGATLLISDEKRFSHAIGTWETEDELTVRVQELCTFLQIGAFLLYRPDWRISFYTAQDASCFPTIPRYFQDMGNVSDDIFATVAVMLGVGMPIEMAVSVAIYTHCQATACYGERLNPLSEDIRTC